MNPITEQLIKSMFIAIAEVGVATGITLGLYFSLSKFFDTRVEITKVKAKESNAGETAIKDIKERLDSLENVTKEIRKDFGERHDTLLQHFKELMTEILKSSLKK